MPRRQILKAKQPPERAYEPQQRHVHRGIITEAVCSVKLKATLVKQFAPVGKTVYVRGVAPYGIGIIAPDSQAQQRQHREPYAAAQRAQALAVRRAPLHRIVQADHHYPAQAGVQRPFLGLPVGKFFRLRIRGSVGTGLESGEARPCAAALAFGDAYLLEPRVPRAVAAVTAQPERQRDLILVFAGLARQAHFLPPALRIEYGNGAGAGIEYGYVRASAGAVAGSLYKTAYLIDSVRLHSDILHPAGVVGLKGKNMQRVLPVFQGRLKKTGVLFPGVGIPARRLILAGLGLKPRIGCQVFRSGHEARQQHADQ